MKKKNPDAGGLVYSTASDYDLTPEPAEQQATLPPQQQDLRVTLDKKLKGGKKATVVYKFVGTADDLEALGKRLKTVCGVGGSVKDGEIILQGDCLQKVGDELKKLGYKYKFAGI